MLGLHVLHYMKHSLLYPKEPFEFVRAGKSYNQSSNIVRDANGKLWLLKSDKAYQELQTGAEVISAALYRKLGYVTPDAHIVSYEGKRWVALEWMGDHIKVVDQKVIRTPEFQQLRVYASWLLDWDRLGGPIGDHVFETPSGNLGLLDFGGTLGSTGMGKHKPGKVISDQLGAFDGNEDGASIFNKGFNVAYLPPGHPWHNVSNQDRRAAAAKLRTVSDSDIDEAVARAKYTDPRDSAEIAKALKNRRDALADYLEKGPTRAAVSRVSETEAIKARAELDKQGDLFASVGIASEKPSLIDPQVRVVELTTGHALKIHPSGEVDFLLKQGLERVAMGSGFEITLEVGKSETTLPYGAKLIRNQSGTVKLVSKSGHSLVLAAGKKSRPVGPPAPITDNVTPTRISPTETFTIERGRIKIVWDRGPSAGKVSMEFTPLTTEQLAAAPDIKNIQDGIDQRLRAIAKAKGEKQEELMAELKLHLFKLYYGTEESPGLNSTRFYIPAHHGFVTDLEGVQIFRWLAIRSGQLRFKKNPYKNLGSGYLERDALYQYFTGKSPREYPNEYVNERDPVYLTHLTGSSALSGILNERALKSGGARNAEIPKLTGEAGAGRPSMDPGAVSFWRTIGSKTQIIVNSRGTSNFEYPIMFGISKSAARDLTLKPGEMYEELKVPDSVSLTTVTHVFVPYFMMDEVAAMLQLHGFDHIQVLPLGFRNGRPILRP